VKPKTLYASLCVLGFVLPYSQFVPFLLEHGFNVRLLIQQLFASRASGFFTLDVLVSSVVVVCFVRIDGRSRDVPHRGAPIFALLTVGVSLALPLYLYLRETHLEQTNAAELSGSSA
jgi:Terpene cyclase DEP1